MRTIGGPASTYHGRAPAHEDVLLLGFARHRLARTLLALAPLHARAQASPPVRLTLMSAGACRQVVLGRLAADRVANGQADMALQQVSEIPPVKGVQLAGMLPAK